MSATLFELGKVVATPAVLDLGIDVIPYLIMHSIGCWGDLGREDWQENDLSIQQGFRIFSAYETSAGCIWIITEADRSVTTILLPGEY